MNFFVVWLTDKRCLALFPAGTIARGPHQVESPILLSSGFVELSCAVVITTTSGAKPLHHGVTICTSCYYFFLLLALFVL